MGEKKRVAINMLSQLTSFVVGLAISFVLTRQIAKLLGKDIYGFVGMGKLYHSVYSSIERYAEPLCYH